MFIPPQTSVPRERKRARGMPPDRRWCGLWIICLLLLLLPAHGQTNAAGPVFHSNIRIASDAAGLDHSLVLLVFGADWCAPCKQLKAKTLDSPEFKEQAGALHLVTIDVDMDAATARDYGVETIPTLIAMSPDNKIVSRQSGFMATAELLLWLREARERLRQGKWEGTTPGSTTREFIASLPGSALKPEDFVRLIELLGEPAPADREAAAKVLVNQREKAIVPLIHALTNSYLGVRIAAGELLQALAPESPAIDPWQAPSEVAPQVAAMENWWKDTGKLPPQAPKRPLDPASANSIAAALENLRGADPILRTRAMSVLLTHGAAALPSVRAAIKSAEQAGDQRVMTLLEDIRWAILIPDAIEASASGVRQVLARGKGPERQAAALRLARAGKDAIDALAELLEDADPLVVESAARALSSIGGKDSIPAIAALLKARDSNLRMTAAQALGRTKNVLAVSELLTVLDDSNEIVVCTALAALEELNATRSYSSSSKGQPPEVVEALRKCLADPRWRVRAAAAEIAGKLEAKELTDDLQPLLNDPDGFVVKNALASLRRFSSSPDPDLLVKVSEKHPGLRGEIVELMVGWATPAAVKAVMDMYGSGDAQGRLAVLDSLASARSADQETSPWEKLLKQASQESDAALRRAAATALASQPPRTAAALITPLITDADPETRARAAGVVLSVLGGERVVRSASHGTFSEDFYFESYSALMPGTRQASAKTNQPAYTADQVAAWHEGLKKAAGADSDILTAAAIYVTGTTNAELPVLQKALESANKDALNRLSQSAALAAIMPRLPWPAGKTVAEQFCRFPPLYLRSLRYTQSSSKGLTEFLLEPARFCASVEPATVDQLSGTLPQMLRSEQGRFSLASGTPQAAAILTKLVTCTNAAWRAAALHTLAFNSEEGGDPAIFQKATGDSHPSVRAAAAIGLAQTAKDRVTLEQRMAPLLSDPDRKVTRTAAVALLEPATRNAASFGLGLDYFEFEKIHAWIGSSRSEEEQRPIAVLETRPPFLQQLRERLEQGSREDAVVPALLLAQYGDFTGLDRILAWPAEDQKEDELDAFTLAMIALSRDSKYMPEVRRMLGAAKEDYEYRRFLQALKGITGKEARELRLEINRRIRRGST